MREHDICEVCVNSKGNVTHVAREMMFGFRDRFEYLECGRCGCLQLKNVPADLSAYYPPDYYSFSESAAPSMGWIGMTLRRMRSGLMLHETPRLARLVSTHRLEPVWVPWLRGRVTTRSRILDLGCGAGHLLLELRRQGFRNLTGVDAFIADTIRYATGLTIFKSRLEDVGGTFDFVMLNHSFEHMPCPLDVLKRIFHLLRPGGAALLRIPLADSFAWRTYRTHWVQLDAPRHLFLHTKASIALLASRSGFTTTDIRYDSSAFQFWGSEQYRAGIPLSARRKIFSPREMRDFERRAHELNRRGDGDQASFHLSPTVPRD